MSWNSIKIFLYNQWNVSSTMKMFFWIRNNLDKIISLGFKTISLLWIVALIWLDIEIYNRFNGGELSTYFIVPLILTCALYVIEKWFTSFEQFV